MFADLADIHFFSSKLFADADVWEVESVLGNGNFGESAPVELESNAFPIETSKKLLDWATDEGQKEELVDALSTGFPSMGRETPGVQGFLNRKGLEVEPVEKLIPAHEDDVQFYIDNLFSLVGGYEIKNAFEKAGGLIQERAVSYYSDRKSPRENALSVLNWVESNGLRKEFAEAMANEFPIVGLGKEGVINYLQRAQQE